MVSPQSNSQGTSHSYTIISDPKEILSDGLSPTTQPYTKPALENYEESKSLDKSLLKDFDIIVDPKKAKVQNLTVSLSDSDEDEEEEEVQTQEPASTEDKLLQAFLARF